MTAPSRSIDVTSTAQVKRLAIRLAPYAWRFPDLERDRIDAHWRDLQAHKPNLFDGRVLLSRDIGCNGDTLTGFAFVTGYKSFLSWRDFGYPGDIGLANLFAMPALRSADGAFLLGRMSSGTANAGRLYFPAGTPEPSDVGTDGFLDLEANILRELEEETGLTSADVALDDEWTIMFAGPQIACLKIATTAFSAEDIQARVCRFIANDPAAELDGMHPVRHAGDLDSARMPPFMVHYLRSRIRGG